MHQYDFLCVIPLIFLALTSAALFSNDTFSVNLPSAVSVSKMTISGYPELFQKTEKAPQNCAE